MGQHKKSFNVKFPVQRFRPKRNLVNYFFSLPNPWRRGETLSPAANLASFGKHVFQLSGALKPRRVPRPFFRIQDRKLKELGQSVALLYPWHRLRPIEFILGYRLPRRLKALNSYAGVVFNQFNTFSSKFARKLLTYSFVSKLLPQFFSSRRANNLQLFSNRSVYPFYRYGNGFNYDFYSPVAHSFHRPFFRHGFLNSWTPPTKINVPSQFSSLYFEFSRLYRLSYLHLHRRFLNFSLLGEKFFRFNFPKPHKLGFEIWRRRRNLFASFVPPPGGGPFFRTTVGASGLKGPDKRSFEAPRQVAIRLYQWISKRFMRRFTRPNASLPTLVFRIRSALTPKMRSVLFYFFKFLKTLSNFGAFGRVSYLKLRPNVLFNQTGFIFYSPMKVIPKIIRPKPSPIRKKPRFPFKSPFLVRLASPLPIYSRLRWESQNLIRGNYYLPRGGFIYHPESKANSGSIFSHGLYIPRHTHGGSVRFSAIRRRKNRRRLKVKRRLGFSSPLA